MIRLLGALACALPFAVNAAVVTLTPEKGKVEFTAVGRPAAIKIGGTGPGPAGRFELKKDGANALLSGDMTLDLDALDTGISMRDRHMKEKYLETAKFKTAALKIAAAPIASAVVTAGGDVKVPATLTLHGVEKPVEVSMKLAVQGKELRCQSQFQILLTDYALEIPKFSGITVANEVDVRVETLVESGGLL